MRTELLQKLVEKCKEKNTNLNETLKRNFFGSYVLNPNEFKFDQEERQTIKSIASLVTDGISMKSNNLTIEWMSNEKKWYFDQKNGTENVENEIIAPFASMNLLSKLTKIGKNNAYRPKNGYRYSHEVKRYAAYTRILSGRLAYSTLHANTFGLIPSISAIDKYVYKPENIVIEGELRSDELLAYLQGRKQPLWVVLSEDATVVDNRVQYDARTNQLIGFVLPTNEQTGMPIPFAFKTERLDDFVKHFGTATVASYINTVMARPIGDAPAFCLLLFGSDNRYNADIVANRWENITIELEKIGIGVLVISSDSDPKFNSAMRKNSNLGHDSGIFSGSDLFKCGNKLSPPFYIQDTPHIGTKMRNLMLQTNRNPIRLPFGNKQIQMKHLQTLVDKFDKTEHFLTKTTLNPTDRQNYDSVLRICSQSVIKMLKTHIKQDSEATVLFLEIMSNSIEAFMSEKLLPLERIGKIWFAVFMARIWKYYVSKNPLYTLKDNFMSTYLYSCLELNAHSIVFIVLFLKENNLSQLFVPWLFNSQACEKFYAQIRSLCSTYSMVASCSVKEAVSRISKIHLLNEISNDTESGFVYPKSNHALTSSSKSSNFELPSESEIYGEIFKSKSMAIKSGIKIGLVKKGKEYEDSCACQIGPYMPPNVKVNRQDTSEKNLFDLTRFRASVFRLKNFAQKFESEEVGTTGSFLEIPHCKRKFVVKKSSLCWLLRKETPKLSSDRLMRVRGGNRGRASKKKITIKKIKPFAKYLPAKPILKKRKACKK